MELADSSPVLQRSGTEPSCQGAAQLELSFSHTLEAGPTLKGQWSRLSESWLEALQEVRKSREFHALADFLEEEHRQGTPVFPPPEHWLRALIETDLAQVRVVILGQDPYHGRNQAIGVAFAVPNALKRKPPSLLNLFKEVSADLNRPVSRELSDLSGWQEQGVLLLNTVLTVREAQPLSHRGRGWEEVTDAVLRALNDHPSPKVFLLWGGPAQAKKEFLTHPAHLVLEAPHPSPLSAYRGFLGCRHFSQANRFLVERRMPAIDWQKTTRTHPVYC